MPETISVSVNGRRLDVPRNSTALAAIMMSGTTIVRRSVGGEPRGPLCGMGICFECRATVNDSPHSRSCQILCEQGMEIRTDA
ncbi:MAG TPA: (2Fe-2S)-binding protein [Candidatus Acidoferrales bacterium]|nr:(2Fe-2S)-binding protein [Candidatus Acidoferrales bacterium]